jgi:hypothetical protein
MPVSNDFAVQMDTSALVADRSEWDRKVRSDLATELEGQFPGPAFSVLGAQRMLAIKGYRGGLHGEAAQHAMHWLRGLVRGYVVHEMTGSFVKPVDTDRGFDLGISIFLRGLSVLREEFSEHAGAQLAPAD